MGLREWLMILGGVVLLLIIADGIRRMRKMHQDQDPIDEEEQRRQEQLRQELPEGKARVVKTHDVEVFDNDPIPVLRYEVDVPDVLKRADSTATSLPGHDTDSDTEVDTHKVPEDNPEPEASRESLSEQTLPADDMDQSADDEDVSHTDDSFSDYVDRYRQETAQQEHAQSADAQTENLRDESDDDPSEPLEHKFARAKARMQEESPPEPSELTNEPEEEDDPVKAAARRIMGKHTGPRPSERMAMAEKNQPQEPEPETEVSLAEQEYLAQEAARIDAERREHEEQARLEAEKAEKAARLLRSIRPGLLTEDQEREQLAEADELLVMHVKCRDSQGFHGSALLHVVMQCGMQLGEMQVFHRFEKTEHGPKIQFSMLSSIEPGTFDIYHLDELYIPSVSFIMSLPAPDSSRQCFHMMLETAKVIVRHLNGELRDEDRSVMTPQTIEHYKQRIQNFERRKQLARSMR